MTRERALPYVAYNIDDALSVRAPEERPDNARLIGWQCGFEPLFVAVWSYLPGVRLNGDDAVEIATDYLKEIGWFSGEPTEPDYIL